MRRNDRIAAARAGPSVPFAPRGPADRMSRASRRVQPSASSASAARSFRLRRHRWPAPRSASRAGPEADRRRRRPEDTRRRAAVRAGARREPSANFQAAAGSPSRQHERRVRAAPHHGRARLDRLHERRRARCRSVVHRLREQQARDRPRRHASSAGTLPSASSSTRVALVCPSSRSPRRASSRYDFARPFPREQREIHRTVLDVAVLALDPDDLVVRQAIELILDGTDRLIEQDAGRCACWTRTRLRTMDSIFVGPGSGSRAFRGSGVPRFRGSGSGFSVQGSSSGRVCTSERNPGTPNSGTPEPKEVIVT